MRNLLTNLTLNVTLLYAVLALDPYYLENIPELFAKLLHQKPLISMLMRCNMVYFYPVSFVLGQIYLNIFGRNIVSLLDSQCFQLAFQWTLVKSQSVACGIVCLNTITFALFYFDTFYLEKQWPSLVDLVRILCCLVMYSQFYCFFGIILYFQFASYCSLKRLALLSSTNRHSEERIGK